MTIYEKELQRLKPDDEVQNTIHDARDRGYDFIMTAGHGYLIVPRNDKYAYIARIICEYGYIGKLAVYLEEDCEAGEFLKQIAILENRENNQENIKE